MAYRITDGIEIQTVDDLRGYEAWTLLASDVPMPGHYDEWDGTEFREGRERRVDAHAGAAHIAWARAVKSTEARMIIGGFQDPLFILVREAEVRGITAYELAELVIKQEAAARDREIQRIADKAEKALL